MRYEALRRWFELASAVSMHNNLIDDILREFSPDDEEQVALQQGLVSSDAVLVETGFFTFVNNRTLSALINDTENCPLRLDELHDLKQVAN